MSKMAEVFTAEQRIAELVDGFYDGSEEEIAARVTEYNEVRDVLLNYYGEDAELDKVDPLMGNAFSDIYKERNGMRPRGWSFRAATKWMQDDADYLAGLETEDDDRFDPDISTWTDEDDLAEAQNGADVHGFSPFACLASLQLRDRRE